MKKKALSMLLALALILTLLPAGTYAEAAQNNITTYVTISVAGTVPVGTDKTDSDKSTLMALAPVTVTDQNANNKFDIDDALCAAHTRYSSVGDYAQSSGWLSKLWGKAEGVGGYYVNDAIINANLYSEIHNGDRVAAFTYADTSGWSDAYAFFDRSTAFVAVGGTLDLTLCGSTWSGTSPVVGAQLILIDASTGTKTNITGNTTSDTNGTVSLVFDTEGNYYVSANPASGYITAPICKVNVLSTVAAESVMNTDKEALSLPASVTCDITLPTLGVSGKTTVTWSSSETSVISDSGKVVRSTSEDKSATLTATISLSGAVSVSKDFNITVPKAEESEISTAQTAISAVKSALTFDVIKGANAAPYAIDSKLRLPIFASYDSGESKVVFSSESGDFAVSWSSANSAILADGKVTQGQSNVSCAVTATIHCIALDGIVTDQTAALSLTVLSNIYSGALSDTALCNIVAGNIAKSYQQNVDTSNYAWVIADMVAANAAKVYGSKNNTDITYDLTAVQKQAYIDHAIGVMDQDNVGASDLAKNIIGLAALGYDPRNLTAATGESFNAVSKLTAKVGSETSIYTLPYMLIAFRQFGKSYQTQIDTLINQIVGTAKWGYGATDADGAGPALLALAPYYGNASYTNVTSAVNSQIETLESSITLNENGAVVSWHSPSAESTAMLVMGLIAVDHSVTCFNKKDLLNGLLAMADNSGSGFVYGGSLSTYSTEQGLRGLIAVAGSTVTGFRLYDFSSNTLVPAAATWYKACPVSFAVIPSDAQVTVTGQTAVYGNCFDLATGSYDYKVSKDGYTNKAGTLNVADSDVTNHALKTVYVSLPSAPSGSATCTVRFTLVGDINHDDINKHIYKQDNGVGRTWIATESISVNIGSSAFDVFDKALTEAGYLYREKGESYIRDIVTPTGSTLSEFDNGSGSGWMYLVNGVSLKVGLRDYAVANGDNIVFFYTDDYTKETGSEQWSTPTETSSSNGKLTPAVTAQDGRAEAIIGAEAINNALSQNSGKVVIAPKITGSAQSVSVSIPGSSFKAIAENSSGTLSVQSDCGIVSMPNEVLNSVCGQVGSSDVKMTIETKSAKEVKLPESDLENASIVEISISSAGKNITTFGGASLGVSIPVTENYKTGDNYKVIVISSDGTADTLVGKVSTINGKSFVEVYVKHLSTFVVTNTPVAVFDDVKSDSWYYDAVQYTTQKGMMEGVGETTFAPNVEISRAMLVTVLYRFAGAPAVSGENSFSDVPKGEWYTDAIIWASKNRIVNGRGNGSFGTNEHVKREEAAAILYRYAELKKLEVSKTTDISVYQDVSAVSSWALNSMRWANASGLITGTTANTLSPSGSMTRAQAATILMRLNLYSTTALPSESFYALDATAAYMLKTVREPQIGSIGGEWAVIGLARSGYNVPQTWLDNYYETVAKYVSACKGNLSSTKYTEYSRVILTLTAIGKSADNVNGYDLTNYLADYENVVRQGLNGSIWALIALDSGNYDIPKNPEAKVQATREMYLKEILSKQLSGGGFSITGEEPADVDMTAMALCALSRYQTQSDVALAVEESIKYLSQAQQSNGAYASCCESTAQVIIALCSLGISKNDSRFVKNGFTLTDGLMNYYRGDGQFKHVSGGAVNQMATEQALLALAALQRVERSESAIYHLSSAE